jgi:hypothetical protein
MANLARAAVEAEHTELPVEPWVIGVVALAVFLLLLIGLLIFGKGRAHA